MFEYVIFFFFAAVAVIFALVVITNRNPVVSALSLVVSFFALAVMYVLLDAPFLAALQVIVYAGAIMVLFVFVIMLLNAGTEERTSGSKVALLLGIPGVIVLGCLVGWILISSNQRLGGIRISTTNFGDTHNIARLLFQNFLLPFEITSVLILIAIMGAVVLGRRSS
jgi:NADH-quinone oxidoreductase subunit J